MWLHIWSLENVFSLFAHVFQLFTCYAWYLQPNMQSKLQKEGSESELFWEILGGKSEYPSQKIVRDAESDPHLFSCTFLKGWIHHLLISPDVSCWIPLLLAGKILINFFLFIAFCWHLCWFRRSEGVYYLLFFRLYIFFPLLITFYVVLMQVTEIYNFNQDDLMTEDIFILDCHSSIFVWVGQQVDQKLKAEALVIGEVYYFVFQL